MKRQMPLMKLLNVLQYKKFGILDVFVNQTLVIRKVFNQHSNKYISFLSFSKHIVFLAGDKMGVEVLMS